MFGKITFPTKDRQQREEERIRAEMAQRAYQQTGVQDYPRPMQGVPIKPTPESIQQTIAQYQAKQQQVPTEIQGPPAPLQGPQVPEQMKPMQMPEGLTEKDSQTINKIRTNLNINRQTKDETTSIVDTVHKFSNFLASPQGLRSISMFLPADTAVLLNRRAGQIESNRAALAKKQFKPEYIKGVGIFDPNTKQIEPGTSPQELGVPATTDPEKFKQETSLRDKFQTLTKSFRDVRDSYSRVRVSGKDPSAAGDLALIFNYMKVLDPGSVVRESEFATAQNAGGVDDRTRAVYNRVLRGERLSNKIRLDFLDRAKRLFTGKEQQYKKTSNEYRKLAKAYRLDPQRVVLEHGIVAEPAPKKSTKRKITDEDRQALDWARANPNDPRAAQILQMQGGQ